MTKIMAEEKRELLKEIEYWSGLIDDHKNQKSYPAVLTTRKQNYETASKRISQPQSQTRFQYSNISVKRQVNSNQIWVKVNSKVSQQKTETPSRVVIPTESMLRLKESTNRLVFRSSTPVPHAKLKNLTSEFTLSPIITGKKEESPKQQSVERTIIAESKVKIANMKKLVVPKPNDKNDEGSSIQIVNSNQKPAGRIVLKPTPYKWTSKPKLSTSPVQVAASQVRNVPVNLINSAKKLLVTGNSAFRMSRLSTSGSGKKNKTIKTKYKLIRDRSISGTNGFRGRHKIINVTTRRVSPKFVRRVGKYSIKYVAKERKTTPKLFLRNYSLQKSSSKRNLVYRNSSVLRISRSSPKRFTIDRTGRFSNASGNFVKIGGIVYKSSRNKLSRTDKTGLTMSETSTKQGSQSSKIITVRGIKFALDSAGKTLKRMAENNDQEKIQNLSRVDIGGETFIQTQPGLLIRSHATKTRTFANRSVNRSINRLVAAKKKSSQFCLFYNRFGKCTKQGLGTCPYIHDPDKIAVCTRFLHGKCSVENCPFSHKICTSKMPVCSYFLLGRCTAEECLYRHVNVNPMAEICYDFVNGYCSLGEKCKNHHVFACPEFGRSGQCPRKEKCPLKHIVRQKQDKKVKMETEVQPDRVDSVPNNMDLPAGETPGSSGARLPSFIKLDDSDLPVSEISLPTRGPLKIRPQFLS